MKTIKMVALVGGEEVVVGRCHPGEARILRRSGLAEWSKDKLTLLNHNNPVPEDMKFKASEADIQVVRDLIDYGLKDPELSVAMSFQKFKIDSLKKQWGDSWVLAPQHSPEQWGTHETIYAKAIEQTPEFKNLLEEELRRVERRIPGGDFPSSPETQESKDAKSWLTEIINRKKAGHTLLVCDDARHLKLGFVDDNDNLCFTLSLWKIRAAEEGVFEELGLSRDLLSSSEKREEFIGKFLDLPQSEEPRVEIPEGVTLESLWSEDAEREATEYFTEMLFPEEAIEELQDPDRSGSK